MEKPKTLAIVGMSPSSRGDAPWKNPEITIAGLNEEYAFPWFKRKEGNLVWFQLHPRASFTRTENQNQSEAYGNILTKEETTDPCKLRHWDWLQTEYRFPIYMQQRWADIPSSVPFPFDEIVNTYGNYFCSTPAYILAWGVLNGFKRIEIYGTDMSAGTEYLFQRANMHFWIGYFKGMGIDIFIPAVSKLMTGYADYGYDDIMLGARQSMEINANHILVKLKDDMKKTNYAVGAWKGLIEACKLYPELGEECDRAEHEADKLREYFYRNHGIASGLKSACKIYDEFVGLDRGIER